MERNEENVCNNGSCFLIEQMNHTTIKIKKITQILCIDCNKILLITFTIDRYIHCT